MCQETKCPICDELYTKERIKTKHHIFPKLWYVINLTVYACSVCHQQEFHHLYPMRKRVWTRGECIRYWVNYCSLKQKSAYKIYPHLKGYLLDNL